MGTFRGQMIKKLIKNQKKYAIVSFIAVTGIFLLMSAFQFEWYIKMTITAAYLIIALLIVGYGRGGLPVLVMILAYFGFIAVAVAISLGISVLTQQEGFTEFSSITNVVNAILIFLLVATQFPTKLKHKTKVWLNQKADLIGSEEPLIPVLITEHQKFSAHYSTYKAKRSNKILKAKPDHFRNMDSKQGAIRLVVYTLALSLGLVLAVAGAMDYTSGRFLYSASYYVTLIGLEIAVYGYFVLRNGFKAAFRYAAIGSAVLMTLSIALDLVFQFYPNKMVSFYISTSILLMSIGIASALGIRHLLLKNTIAMLIFRRKELWLGLELLLKDTLPIIGYDHMVMVKITADDEFDLAKLMDLGPSIEVFAHLRKMIFAGLKYDPDQQIIELYFCTKNEVYAQRQLKVFFKRHFHYPFTMIVFNDPLSVINERLNPTDLEKIEAMNRHTVMHYEDEDIDPTEIHPIVMILHFKEASPMTQAKNDLEAAGYVRLLLTDDRRFTDNPASEANGWFVISLETESRLGIDRINLVTRQIAQVIRPYEGTLSYWILGKLNKTENEPND